MNNQEFSIDNYKSLLIKAQNLGYQFQTFYEYMLDPKSPVILLRHDVDVSLEYALVMAECEYQLNVRSTYFVRIHSTLYNLFDRVNYRRLHKLLQMGFEIGVHQEVANFLPDWHDALELLKTEKLIIEAILGQPVYGVADHLPKWNSIQMTKDILEKTGFKYCPGDEIFNQNAIFISDANKRWKQYSFADALGRHSKILANIHPVWWVAQIEDVSALIEFLKEGN